MMVISDASTSLSFNISSKLALLKQRREAWQALQTVYRFDQEAREDGSRSLYVRIDFGESSIYDFSASLYMLGEQQTSFSVPAQSDLSTVRSQYEVMRTRARGLLLMAFDWPSVKVANEEWIVDFGVSLREHDLIALITETPSQEGCVALHQKNPVSQSNESLLTGWLW
jgi:hypothetical protein